jgi:hypothetical protein
MNLAPIIVFVYNRPEHTKSTLEALSRNFLADHSQLYVFADGPKANATPEDLAKIQKVRNVVRGREWCKSTTLIEREKNLGLAENIVQGVSGIVNQFGKVIVLEDDIVTSRGFLTFMNQCLAMYEDDSSVMHISGYMYPLKIQLPETVFLNVVTPWGWATWKRAWDNFDFDAERLHAKLMAIPNLDLRDYNAGYGREFYNQLVANVKGSLKTWAVKWHTVIYLNKGFCLHPGRSLVANIGFDGSGEHCGVDEKFMSSLAESVNVTLTPVQQLPEVLRAFREFFLSHNKGDGKQRGALDRIITRFKKMIR